MGFTDGQNVHSWTHPWSRTNSIINLPSDSNIGMDGRFIWKVKA